MKEGANDCSKIANSSERNAVVHNKHAKSAPINT